MSIKGCCSQVLNAEAEYLSTLHCRSLLSEHRAMMVASLEVSAVKGKSREGQ